ncbi:MAG TPA: hypothetical protein VGN35_12935 [Jatrophihabitantaceae bacterium]|nr:hypothetical protein [Jatrophihabitantaceae bacterium]
MNGSRRDEGRTARNAMAVGRSGGPRFDPPPPYGQPRFDPPPSYFGMSAPAVLPRARVQWFGSITTIVGLMTLGLAFASQSNASQLAATSAANCGGSGWSDTVTVTNSPRASNGTATISGTGTALDGAVLAAGGGQQSVTLGEPLSVASVTVAGRLTWQGGKYTAPFSTTALKPASCGAVQNAAAAAPAADPKKVYVCKYVGKPGVDERLQTGQNPIDVSVNAIKEDPVVVGSFFADAQGRSYVLAFDTGQTPPTAADCPPGSIPPTATVTATTTVPGPTVTVTGPTTTVTVTAPVTTTATVTQPAVTTTIPGPTTTVSVPGPTVTLTVSATTTITAPTTVTAPGTTEITTVTAPGTTVTNTVTAPGTTVTNNVTNTVTNTVTVSGQVITLPAVTVTQTVPGCTDAAACPTATVTETVVGPGSTVTVTGAQLPGPTTTVTVTDTATVVNCPPGAGLGGQGAGGQEAGGGNGAGGAAAAGLAYTGAGNDPLMSLLGGALTAAGMTCLIMARRRRPRSH